eukprot:gnl/TRDRNA2_/TRDRNA2_31052_c0_seq1.p1 gnl/TRDRNA2_/TRDRNA2_31052_c0~~gnl/TRDRNA2_/TRDRNA2_31052_c0_seq1.p1  ORF type:complete len:242 (-),score=43.54 gnl/TRDRNA2_/TRDRNA2_31052_c0_seq1:117-842(-)
MPGSLPGARKKEGYFFLGGIPKGGLKKEDSEDTPKAVRDKYSGMWANFSEIPEPITVRCSYELFRDRNESFGDNFRFQVWNLFGDEAAAEMNGLRLSNKFLRRGYDKHISMQKIPNRGQGPCERLRKEAVCTRIFVAEGEPARGSTKGKVAHCVANPGPGGMSDHGEGTAALVVEAAGCVLDALEAGHTLRPGFGTPSYHLAGFGYLKRLAARGISFEVIDDAPAPELFHNAMTAAAPLGA